MGRAYKHYGTGKAVYIYEPLAVVSSGAFSYAMLEHNILYSGLLAALAGLAAVKLLMNFIKGALALPLNYKHHSNGLLQPF